MRKSSTAFVFTLLTVTCMFTTFTLRVDAAESAIENTWQIMEHMPTTRAESGIAVIDKKIYVLGGENQGKYNSQGVYDDGGVYDVKTKTYNFSNRRPDTNGYINEMYDPATNTWAVKTQSPERCYDFTAVVYQNRIYCLCKNIYVYEPSTDSWADFGVIPKPAHYGSACIINDKIYIFGGVAKSGWMGSAEDSNLTRMYDISTNSWFKKASMFIPLGDCLSIAVGDKIYVFGGDKIQIYDTATDSWSIGSSIPTALGYGLSGAMTTGIYAPKRIYLFGDKTTQIFDPETDKWTTGISIPVRSYKCAVAVVDDLLYVIGGDRIEKRSVGGPALDVSFPSNLTYKYTPIGFKNISPDNWIESDITSLIAITGGLTIAILASTGLVLYRKRRF